MKDSRLLASCFYVINNILHNVKDGGVILILLRYIGYQARQIIIVISERPGQCSKLLYCRFVIHITMNRLNAKDNIYFVIILSTIAAKQLTLLSFVAFDTDPKQRFR